MSPASVGFFFAIKFRSQGDHGMTTELTTHKTLVA